MLFVFSVFLIFFIAWAINVIFIPLMIPLFYRHGFIDKRKKEGKEIIRLGGLIMFLSFICSLIFVNQFPNLYILEVQEKSNLFLITISLIPFFLIGILDDIFVLSPFLRLFFQVLTSTIIWSQGISMNIPQILISNLSISNNLADLINLVMTIFWIVGITNALNWLDGLDGLAAGYTAITSVGFILIGIFYSRVDIIILSTGLFGVTAGFLKYNLYPSSLIMGDGGSYFLGSALSMLSLTSLPTNFSFENLFFPFLILFIPVFDMTQVIFTRLASNISPFYPDKRHFHHRLMRSGLNHSKAVFTIYILTFITMFLTFLTVYFQISSVFVFIIFFLNALIILLNKKHFKNLITKIISI